MTAVVLDRPATRRQPGVLRLGLLRGGLELRQFSREKEAVVFTLAFPVILLILFGSVFSRDIAPGVSFTQYFVAGMLAAGLVAACFQNLAIQIPVERDNGALKRLAGTPMPPASYFLGKVLLVAVTSTTSTILLLGIGMAFFGVSLPATGQRWAVFGLVWILGICACTLLGIAFSSVPRSGRTAPAVVSPIAIVFNFISGVFFVYTDLPPWMQQIAALFPLKWMCQGMRYVFLPDSFEGNEVAGSWELGRIVLVLAVWAVVGLALCVATFRWKASRDG
jgi:ABC-2 type transport system permease protein